MSEKIEKEVHTEVEEIKEVEVVEEPKFKIRKIKVKDILVITKYLKEVKLTEAIVDFMRGKDKAPEVTWADVRREKNMTAAELSEAKDIYGNDITKAMLDFGIETPSVDDDMAIELIEKVIEIISDDESFDKTVKFLAFLYEIEEDVILDMEIMELQQLVAGVMANKAFLAVL